MTTQAPDDTPKRCDVHEQVTFNTALSGYVCPDCRVLLTAAAHLMAEEYDRAIADTLFRASLRCPECP